MPSPRLTVETRTAYGVARVYPICAQAKRFAAIAGTRTLTEHALDELRALGFRVVDQAGLAEQVARLLAGQPSC